MALDFPSNTTQPYIDPISGLKYIYNTSVGAWEAAIQPPAVVSSTTPAITIPGFLWWDSDGGALYIYYQDTDTAQWVEASPGGSGSSIVRIGETPPASPPDGELWWNSTDGNLYIYYKDPDGDRQWIQASTYGTATQSVAGATVTAGSTAPNDSKNNDLWYNTTDKTLYINYKTGEVANWVKVHNISQAADAITSITVSGALSVTGSTTAALSVRSADTTNTGVVRLATVTEGTAAQDGTLALSPAVLKQSIGGYLPDASPTVKGVSQIATQAEVVSGSIGDKVVTPKTLKQAMPTLSPGLPAGAIIQFGGSIAPTGYLVCDGALVSRNTYAALFAAIGTTNGIGDGATTFALPNITGTPIHCIKF